MTATACWVAILICKLPVRDSLDGVHQEISYDLKNLALFHEGTRNFRRTGLNVDVFLRDLLMV